MDQHAPERGSVPLWAMPAESSPAKPAEGRPVMPAETVPAPAATAPPPVALNASEPAAAPKGRVTGLAKIASAILIVVGLLITLFGLLLVRDPGFAGIGVIVIVLGVIEVLAGIGSWRGSGAGRVVGIIYGVLGALFGVLRSSDSDVIGLMLGLVYILLFGYVAVVLLFRWKAPATA